MPSDKVKCPCSPRSMGLKHYKWWHQKYSQQHLDWLNNLRRKPRSIASTLPRHKPDISLDNPFPKDEK